MSDNLLSPMLGIGAILLIPLALLGIAVWRLRSHPPSRPKKMLWAGVIFVASLPLAGAMFLLMWFAAANFPFTSGIVAHATSSTGEEVCVVQTFKGAEPYQVSLFARRAGQPWVWHHLAHQDDRWRNGHISFTNGLTHVYTGSTLRKSLTITEAVTVSGDPHDQLPASYTPEQVLAHHNACFHR